MTNLTVRIWEDGQVDTSTMSKVGKEERLSKSCFVDKLKISPHHSTSINATISSENYTLLLCELSDNHGVISNTKQIATPNG